MSRLVWSCGRSSVALITGPVYAARPTRLEPWRRLFALLARVVVLDVALLCASDPQCPGWHVLGDRRACGRPGVVADGDRGHQRDVDPSVYVLADLGAVLVLPVVVGGDGAGPEIRSLPHIGIADVGQVRDLGARAHVR